MVLAFAFSTGRIGPLFLAMRRKGAPLNHLCFCVRRTKQFMSSETFNKTVVIYPRQLAFERMPVGLPQGAMMFRFSNDLTAIILRLKGLVSVLFKAVWMHEA